jgi:hypothetical protein
MRSGYDKREVLKAFHRAGLSQVSFASECAAGKWRRTCFRSPCAIWPSGATPSKLGNNRLGYRIWTASVMVPSEAYVGIQRFAILLVIIFLGVPAGAQQGASRPDPFAALRFLAGTWRGDQAGQPGRGAAERTYQFILNDRFLPRAST